MKLSTQLSFADFVNTIKTLESTINEAIESEWYLEDFFDAVESHGLSLEAVMSGDISTITEPISMMKRKRPYESAPNSPEAEKWIRSNKARFKRRYGDNWESVIYVTSWRLFGKKGKD